MNVMITSMPKLKPRSKYGQTFGEKHYAWKGDGASANSKRERARNLYSLDDCEICGKSGTDRHHKDSNTGNNKPSNILILCRKCHMTVDGRLSRLPHNNIPVKTRTPCRNCGIPSKPLRKGECHKCHEYLRRTGVHRPNNLQPRKIINCPECNRKNVRCVKGVCYWCYAAKWARDDRAKRRSCHTFLHNNPAYARSAGFLK